MRTPILASFLLVLCLPASVMAKDILGIAVPERLQTTDSTLLILNGAGIRKKLFLKVYVGALYLSERNSSAQTILAADESNRFTMHIVLNVISKDKIANAIAEGFDANLSTEDRRDLDKEISAFRALLPEVVKNDQLAFDYTPGQGTKVILNDEHLGSVPGRAFNRALLEIWLGAQPVTQDLKAALLG